MCFSVYNTVCRIFVRRVINFVVISLHYVDVTATMTKGRIFNVRHTCDFLEYFSYAPHYGYKYCILGSETLDMVLVMVVGNVAFCGPVIAFILDNTIPGIQTP